MLILGLLVALWCLSSSWGYSSGFIFKGHLHFGLSRIRHALRQHWPTLLAREAFSSQRCCCCFGPVRLARARRLIHGTASTIRINGAVECLNPSCPLFGRTLARDLNAGECQTHPVAVVM